MIIKAAAAIAVAALAMPAIGCASQGTHTGGSASAAAGHGAAARTQTPGTSATPSGSTAPARPPSAATKLCGLPDAPGRAINLRAADRVRLAAIEAGAGKRGVVLIPQLDAIAKCGWWPFAAYLAASGYRVLLFDHRCTGGSACPSGPPGVDLMSDIRGAVARLHRDGAAKVALVGASQGGAEALIAATEPGRDVTGVVALSAANLTVPLASSPYPHTALAAAAHVRLPALLAVADMDPIVSSQDTRSLYARVASLSKYLTVLKGAGHGWDLVSPSPGGGPPIFSQTVLAFLRRVTS
jgi:pimeloyl-ACP methyl ester carboxylesterase